MYRFFIGFRKWLVLKFFGNLHHQFIIRFDTTTLHTFWHFKNILRDIWRLILHTIIHFVWMFKWHFTTSQIKRISLWVFNDLVLYEYDVKNKKHFVDSNINNLGLNYKYFPFCTYNNVFKSMQAYIALTSTIKILFLFIYFLKHFINSSAPQTWTMIKNWVCIRRKSLTKIDFFFYSLFLEFKFEVSHFTIIKQLFTKKKNWRCIKP